MNRHEWTDLHGFTYSVTPTSDPLVCEVLRLAERLREAEELLREVADTSTDCPDCPNCRLHRFLAEVHPSKPEEPATPLAAPQAVTGPPPVGSLWRGTWLRSFADA